MGVGVGHRLNFGVSEKRSRDFLNFIFFTVFPVRDLAYSVDFVSLKISKTPQITNGNRHFWIKKIFFKFIVKRLEYFEKNSIVFPPAIVLLQSFFLKHGCIA